MAELIYRITGDPDTLAEAKHTLDIYIGNGIDDVNCTDRRGVTLTTEYDAGVAAGPQATPPLQWDGVGIVRLSDCETFTLGERTYDEPTDQHGYEINQGGFISDEAVTSGRWALVVAAPTRQERSVSGCFRPEKLEHRWIEPLPHKDPIPDPRWAAPTGKENQT